MFISKYVVLLCVFVILYIGNYNEALIVNKACVFWQCFAKTAKRPHSCKALNIIFYLPLSCCPVQVVYDKGEIYSFSKHGRFCQEIKLNYSPYTNYFTRVFWNRSYHVYKVNSVISFQYWQQLLPPCWDFTEPGSALLQYFTSCLQCNTEDCNMS